MLPDFNRLKVFHAVFEQQSSTEAAKLLHITQSGVSQHIKKLEQELHTELFTRVNRRLVPTTAGRRLFATVDGFIRCLEKDVRTLDESYEVPAGELRIGSPKEFGKTYLPKAMASFRSRFPKVSFRLELGPPDTLLGHLSTGSLDYAYIDILPIGTDAPVINAGYEIQPILREEFVLTCSQPYYADHVRNEDYDTLTKLEYVGFRDDIALFQSWFKVQFDKEPDTLDQVLVVDDIGAVISAAEAGLGLGIVGSHLVNKQMADKSLIPIAGHHKRLESIVACVQFRNKTATLAERYFQKHVLGELAQIPHLSLE